MIEGPIEHFLPMINTFPVKVDDKRIAAITMAAYYNRRFLQGLNAIHEIHTVLEQAQKYGDKPEAVLPQIVVALIAYEKAVFGSTRYTLDNFGE